MENNEEIWRDIPGYEGAYQASNLGRIRSLDRTCKHSRGGIKPIRGKVLRQHLTRNGYLRVYVYSDSVDRFVQVHRLVLAAFTGRFDHQGNHLNGVKSDNRLENLEWVATGSENMEHAIRTKLLDQRGEKHHNAKLTDAQTYEIRALLAAGHLHQGQIAERFKVARSTITAIKRGAIRKNV